METRQIEEKILALGENLLHSNFRLRNDFLPLLKGILEVLLLVDQGPPGSTLEALKPCIEALVLPELLSNKNPEVQLWIAACTTEVMRIVAPNAPYEDDQIKGIFKLILKAFEGLDEISSPLYKTRVTILETVAKVQLCMIMLNFELDILIFQMFKNFFLRIRNEHPVSVFWSMATIMALVINEGYDMLQKVVKLLRSNLCTNFFSPPHRLALRVLHQCASKLEPYVEDLLSSKEKDKTARQEDLKEIYPLHLYVSYCCDLKLMPSVAPVVLKELQLGQPDARKKAVYVLGRMFALPVERIPQECQQLFHAFLNCFDDNDVEIRLAAVDCAGGCLQDNSSLSQVLTALIRRLLDSDEDVRIMAINTICDLSASNTIHSVEVIMQVAEQLDDKKPSVKLTAYRKLIELYAKYCINCFEAQNPLDHNFEWIPRRILKWCCDSDIGTAKPQAVELVLAEGIFHWLPLQERIRHWLLMSSAFDICDKKALECVLAQKQRLQHEMKRFLDMQDSLKSEHGPTIERRIRSSVKLIAASFVNPANAEEHLDKLNQLRDENTFGDLQTLLDPNTSFSDSIKIQDRLRESKLFHNDFMNELAMKCSYILFGKEHVRVILDEVRRLKLVGNEETAAAGLSLLSVRDILQDALPMLLMWCCNTQIIVGFFPMLVDGTEADLLELLRHKGNASFLENVVDILSKAGHYISQNLTRIRGQALRQDIIGMLKSLCFEGDCRQAKYAVHALISLSPDRTDLTNTYKQLCDSLESHANLPTILCSLGSFAQHATVLFEAEEKRVSHFVVKDLLHRSNVVPFVSESSDWDAMSDLCKLKICGLKVLVKRLLPDEPTIHVEKKRLEHVFSILSQIIQVGEVNNNIKSSGIDKAHLRLEAAKAMLKLANRWDSQFPPEIFHLVIYTIQDPCRDVRYHYLSKTQEYLKGYVLPLKYGIMFALCAMECEENIHNDAKLYLKTFVGMCQREMQLRNSNLYEAPDASLLIYHPGYFLTYLLHALAHHPSFPSSSCDTQAMEPFRCQLRFFIEAVICEEVDQNSCSVLQVIKMVKLAEDAEKVPRTEGIRLLCDIAELLVKEIACAEIRQEISNSSFLVPKGFFKPAKLHDHSESGPLSHIDGENADKGIHVSDTDKDFYLDNQKGMAVDPLISPTSEGSREQESDLGGPTVNGHQESHLESIGHLPGKRVKGRKGKRPFDNQPSTMTLRKRRAAVKSYRAMINEHNPGVELDDRICESISSEQVDIGHMKERVVELQTQSAEHVENDVLESDNSNNIELATKVREDNQHRAVYTRTVRNQTNLTSRGFLKVKIIEPSSEIDLPSQAVNGAQHGSPRGTLQGSLQQTVQTPMPIQNTGQIENENSRSTIEVGQRIKVWWPLDKCYYSGTISSYDFQESLHTIIYDDKEEEVLDLTKERWELEASSSRSVESAKKRKRRRRS